MRKIVVLPITLALAACGGGGGSTYSMPPAVAAPVVTNYPIEISISGAFLSSSNYSASATDTVGNSYQLNFSLAPGADGVVPVLSAKTLKSLVQTALLKKNGVTLATSTTSLYFTAGPFMLYGAHDSQNNTVVATTQTPLPATAAVGAQGSIYSGSQYINGSTLPLNTHAQTATWSLESDSLTTAWLCLNIQTAAFTGPPDIESDCYRINSAGAISGFKADITSQGATLKFR